MVLAHVGGANADIDYFSFSVWETNRADFGFFQIQNKLANWFS